MAALACAAPSFASAATYSPFTVWFQSLAGSAQALADGDAARAETLARVALEARKDGAASERARLALGLALRSIGRREEGDRLVAAALGAADIAVREDVGRAFAPPAPPPPPAPAPVPAPGAASSAAPATAEERLQDVERLVAGARPRDALGALDALAPSELVPEQRQRATLLRAWASLQLGRRDAAEELAREVLGSPDAAPGTRVGAELVAARTAARDRRYDEAIARYEALSTRPAQAVPGLSDGAAAELPVDAAYLAAWLNFDAGRWKPASRALTRFAIEHPRSARTTDARWFAAWAAYRDGRHAEARSAWARLERTPLAAAALYWQARTSPPSRRRALYRRSIAAEPGGWYAFLSAARLRAMGERDSALPATVAIAPRGDPTPAAAEAMSRATALLALGLRDPAIALLRGASAERDARGAAPYFAELSDAAGAADLTYRIARDQLPLSRRSLRWQHPLAFGPGLDALAAACRADPLLFRALIRRESTFREDARSAAGAEGLVQLMPYTADRLATVLGAPGAAPPDLRDADTSLALGAAYLGMLLDRFREPAAALAAYNGGPGPIATWASAHARRPIDEAIEELPFRETRRYVKLVMAAWATYRTLHAGAPATIDGLKRLPAPRRGVAF